MVDFPCKFVYNTCMDEWVLILGHFTYTPKPKQKNRMH